MRQKTATTVETPAEYKEAISAAETLGMEPCDFRYSGDWLADDNGEYDVPCWPRNCEVLDVGYKWFTVMMDGEEQKIRPYDGTLTVGFK